MNVFVITEEWKDGYTGGSSKFLEGCKYDARSAGCKETHTHKKRMKEKKRVVTEEKGTCKSAENVRKRNCNR